MAYFVTPILFVYGFFIFRKKKITYLLCFATPASVRATNITAKNKYDTFLIKTKVQLNLC